MLTLKVKTLNRDGSTSTFLISGERINYNKIRSEPKDDINCNGIIRGRIPKVPVETQGKTDSEEPPEQTGKFDWFGVRVSDNENAIIEELTVFPYSECYIMENGRTVDYFVSKFVE